MGVVAQRLRMCRSRTIELNYSTVQWFSTVSGLNGNLVLGFSGPLAGIGVNPAQGWPMECESDDHAAENHFGSTTMANPSALRGSPQTRRSRFCAAPRSEIRCQRTTILNFLFQTARSIRCLWVSCDAVKRTGRPHRCHGFVIPSGAEVPISDSSVAHSAGVAGETLLYSDDGGVIGAPIELPLFARRAVKGL